MELSHEAVRGIAELAKLELSDAEVATYAEQLSHILAYFEKLQTLDTSHITGIDSVLPFTNMLREDVAKPALTPEEVTRNAPDSQDNQFRVSAVLPE
jgi:aspartyl-tRNA(Asn)/glutamyl-tRNA(Gln) amidotransferase subunit C